MEAVWLLAAVWVADGVAAVPLFATGICTVFSGVTFTVGAADVRAVVLEVCVVVVAACAAGTVLTSNPTATARLKRLISSVYQQWNQRST